ncbi:unnamed protein product, partial [Rotaria magnacalcarata]
MATAVPRNIPLLEVPAANPTQLAASYTSSNSNSIKITNGATTARDVNVHLGSVPAVTSAISRGLSTTTKVILILVTCTALVAIVAVPTIYFTLNARLQRKLQAIDVSFQCLSIGSCKKEEPLLQQHPQRVRHRLRRPVLQVRQQQPQQPRQRQLQLLLRLLQQRQQQRQQQQRQQRLRQQQQLRQQ